MPRRSRGCYECRRRRVGCDGALPSCSQCLRTSRHCPGPLQGSIIIDQTAHVKSRYSNENATNSRAYILVSQPYAARGDWLAVSAPQMYAYVTSAIDVPSRPAWLFQLSELPRDALGPGLDVALQAVAAAYHGVLSNDNSAMLDARRMYGDALSRQSKAISRRWEKPSPAVLYTSVIFSLFESICCTNYAAYATHLAAARKMLALARFELGEDEMLARVAMHVQYQTV